MEFRRSEQDLQFADAVRGFALRNLAEGALERAHARSYPKDVARLMAEQGLLGITIPEDAGGIGGRLFDAILAIEEIAAVCPRSADVIQAGNFGAIRVLAEFGSDQQKQTYLSQLLSGDAVIAIGMTEPEAGSAVTELKTTAEPVDGGFRLNGTKVFTSHMSDAAMILAYVRFGPGTQGIGSVLVDRKSDGVSLGKPVQSLGGETWSQLYLHDVFVPEQNVVLGEGGFKKQIAGFNVERLGNSARALALGRFAFDLARDHALERKQFGRPICEFQGLQWKFADMKVELEAARLLLYRAAINADNGFPSAEETAIAKLACNCAGFNAANEAMQIFGAAGYSQDNLIEYCFRRTRGWMIAGGSLEMMKNRIAENIFERRFSQRP